MASIQDSYDKILGPINAKSLRSAVDSALIYSDPIGKAHQSAAQEEEQKKLEDQLAIDQQLALDELNKQLSSTQASQASQAYQAVVAPPVAAPAVAAAAPVAAVAAAPAASIYSPQQQQLLNARAAYQRPAMLDLPDWNAANGFPSNQSFYIKQTRGDNKGNYYSPYQMYVNEYNGAITARVAAPNPKNNFELPVEQQYPVTFGGKKAPSWIPKDK